MFPSAVVRTLSGLLCASQMLSAQAVTASRLVVDGRASGGNTTYMAMVNDTGHELTVTGTDYTGMVNAPDLAPASIPANYSPSRGQETPYTRAHPLYKAIGLGFDRTFPELKSGGYRYGVQCGSLASLPFCQAPADSRAVTHYATTCNGKPLRFKVTAWTGNEPGEAIPKTLAALGVTVAAPIVFQGLVGAYELGSELFISYKYSSESMGWQKVVEVSSKSNWLANPENTAIRAAAVRASRYLGMLGFAVYYQVKSQLSTMGVLGAQMSYVNVSADGDSRVTRVISDTPLEQHLVIDDCLEINAIAQDLPYARSDSDVRLVPDTNDALVTVVFRRRLPEISAARSCLLEVDDSGTRYTGTCPDSEGRSKDVVLDARGCGNAADIVNADGALQCVGEKVAQPVGSYLKACRVLAWDGRSLRTSCGGTYDRRSASIDYARACIPGSALRYDEAAGQLRCESPRPAS